jgi:DNA-binding response OmpR family regulator
MVAERTYNMVLMDCLMPTMDGYEAAERIRQLQGPAAETPIVALTASVGDAEVERCLRAGMNDYLSKPVVMESLAEKVQRWAGRRRPPRPIIDIETVREVRGEDAVNEALRRFDVEGPAWAVVVQRSLEMSDLAAAQRAAGALKRCGVEIGAMRLCEICVEIEAAPTVGQAAERFPDLQHEARRVSAAVAQQLR